MTTRADVARLAGVAESTVSYVLSGTRPIGQATRTRVLEAMEALSYAPNSLAKGLASKRSGVVLLLIPMTERGMHATEFEYVRAVTATAGIAGLQVVVNTMDPADLEGLRKVLAPQLFEGVVVMEARAGDARIEVLKSAGIPFAVIGRTGHDVAFVDSDFEAGGGLAVDYLVGLGHRDVVLLTQPESVLKVGYGPVERLDRAIRSACGRAGAELHTVHVGQSVRAGYQALDEILQARPGVTAVASINEQATIGLVMAAREHGRRVPEDLSVLALGISDVSAASVVPSLTTVGASPAKLGEMAVAMLVDLLKNPEGERPHLLLEMTLTERESTAPAAVDRA